MKKIGTSLMLFLVGALVAPAQNTFIVHFDSVQMGHNSPAFSVTELDDGGFLVSGLQRGHDGDTTGRAHVLLRRTDPQGRVIHESEVHHNVDQTFNNGLLGAMVKDDSLLVMGITRYDPYSWDCGMYLYKFDANGDTISTHELLHYGPLDSTFVQHRQTINLEGGGYAFIGTYDSPAEYRQFYLLKVSCLGDTIWTQKYGSITESDVGFGLTELVDNGFALSGDHTDGGPVDGHTLIRTDSLGNQIWRRQYGNVGTGIPSVRAAPDSTIITFSQYRTSVQPWFDDQLELRKWDMNGTLVWSQLSHEAPGIFPMDFEVLDDGSIVCSVEFGIYAMIAKFNAQGDSLWSRKYMVFDTPNNNPENIPYDIDPTSDGGFIMCGETEQGPQDPTPGLQTMFLIKTDSMGCVVPGCHTVGVEEYATNLQDHLQVWPNPASDHVNVRLDLPPGTNTQGAIRIVLQDALGREVFSSPLLGRGAGGEASFSIQLSTFPTGLYHLHLHDDNTWLAGSKLLVE